jgi:hypothetical protein
MKNKLLKTLIFSFGLLIFLYGCNQTEQSNTVSLKKETEENSIKLNKAEDTSKFETIYNDGRITSVRNSKYYNYLVKDSKPLDTKLGLLTVITEWNKYDANVACPQGGFIQRPLSLTEPQKIEMIEAGVEGNSTMVGGDEETNRRFKEPSIRYWAVASKMFEQEFASLKKAEGISNRDTNYVTFDFITSNGFYTVQEKKSELESGKSIWSNLFKESKFLNTEMARVQNESQEDAQKRYEDRLLKKKKQ